MSAYKFVPYAQEEKPNTEITRLLEKAQNDEALSREEKDRIANNLYGLFSSGRGTYQLAGWAWDLTRCFRRILVKFKWGTSFHAYYAPDKTALRKALPLPIVEMIYA